MPGSCTSSAVVSLQTTIVFRVCPHPRKLDICALGAARTALIASLCLCRWGRSRSASPSGSGEQPQLGYTHTPGSSRSHSSCPIERTCLCGRLLPRAGQRRWVFDRSRSVPPERRLSQPISLHSIKRRKECRRADRVTALPIFIANNAVHEYTSQAQLTRRSASSRLRISRLQVPVPPGRPPSSKSRAAVWSPQS